MIFSPAGNLILHSSISSRFIESGRLVIVYLPPGYDENLQTRYPVLYLQDGQNLFDPATAFANQDWGLSSLLDSLISEEVIEPVVVAGIYNAGVNRLAEYSHVRTSQGVGGKARLYGKFLVHELKPFIDAQYRTKPDVANTASGGSSMGGLVSLYLGLHYPGLFGKLIIMSPSIWWANRAVLREMRKPKGKTDQKIWLDVGTAEGNDPGPIVQDARDLRDVLTGRGWCLGQDLRFVEDEGAGHNEKAWSCRMRDALAFLFPAGSSLHAAEFDAQPELHC